MIQLSTLDRMLELTAEAKVNGQKCEGVDHFLFHPHTDPHASDEAIGATSNKIAAKGLAIGSPPCGRVLSAARWWEPIKIARILCWRQKKVCRNAKLLNQRGVRKYGVIRIDSADEPCNRRYGGRGYYRSQSSVRAADAALPNSLAVLEMLGNFKRITRGRLVDAE